MFARRLIQRPLRVSSTWLCPSCANTSSLLLSPVRHTRSLRTLPALNYHEQFSEEGVPGVFSRDGYSVAWTQYQTILLNRLDELTAGEPIENATPKDIALMYARDPMKANLFNYASAAFNNHAFFKTLAFRPTPIEKCPLLLKRLLATFGTIETFRATMLHTAASMFGPGYVWLVWVRLSSGSSGAQAGTTGDWRILTTYLAGTPFPEAGYRQQGIDMANNNLSSYDAYLKSQHLQPANTVGSFGRYSQSGQDAAKLPPGGTSLMPVLCVSTWEHTWLPDYHLHGKRAFLEAWWNAIDWGAVDQLAPLEAKMTNSRFLTN